MSLSVVIPALDAAATIAGTLASVEDADEIVVVDGGSSDDTVEIATSFGARVVRTTRSRGSQLSAGACAAGGAWLLFLHADTRLETGWRDAVDNFASQPSAKLNAATFEFALDDTSARARRLERVVKWRVRTLGLPYGDQGLFIHRGFYESIGGFRALPIMEDVDIALRIGKSRLITLPAIARTSASRWHRSGWTARSAHNLFCLALYFLGVPPRFIARIYG